MEFGNMKLCVVRRKDVQKAKGEWLRKTLFEQWVIEHPNDQQLQKLKLCYILQSK
jgi:hypothetical protein